MSTPKDYGIVGNRKLTPAQQGQVRARFLRGQMRKRGVEPPRLDELRWSDEYAFLYVPTRSGLLDHGFRDVPLGPALPRHIDEHCVIFDRNNPAARSLLGAIEEVLRHGEFASAEARAAYGTDR